MSANVSAFLLGTGRSQRADDVGAARAGAGQRSPLLRVAAGPWPSVQAAALRAALLPKQLEKPAGGCSGS